MNTSLRAFLAAFMFLPLACTAETPASTAKPTIEIKEGRDYKRARTVQADSVKDKVEVAEVFWYGCPHCFQFDTPLEKWLETVPSNVLFTRIPNSLGRPQGLLHSRAFYTAESLGVLDKLHPALFHAIHKERKPLASEAQIAEVFVANGVDKETFTKTFNSFFVDNRVRRAEALVREIGISSVPAVVVEGKYWTNAKFGKGFDGALKVVDALIAQETTK